MDGIELFGQCEFFLFIYFILLKYPALNTNGYSVKEPFLFITGSTCWRWGFIYIFLFTIICITTSLEQISESNSFFLAFFARLFFIQTIFSDNTYSKPFFVTYLNTSFFIFPLLSILGHRLFRLWRAGKLSKATTFRTLLDQLDSHEAADESLPFLTAHDDVDVGGDSGRGNRYQGLRADDDGLAEDDDKVDSASERLGFKATAKLSLEFCLVWVRDDQPPFLLSYFA